jgi:hypothetical protein
MPTIMKTFSWLMALLCACSITLGAAEGPPKKGKLQHVVAFKFKATATPDQVRGVEQAFQGLKKTIKEIKALEWGTNVSPEKHAKGFTHCFILTFKTEKDRDAYIVHPEHQAFGKLVGPVLDDVFVVDFWAQP